MDYEQLRKRIDGKLAVNPEFRSIVRRISSGTATFADTSKYAQILSSTIGNELSANVLELSDREQITQQLLRYGYKDINEVCARVQSSLDKTIGVSIRPQTADFPEERVQQFSHSLVDPTVEDSVIQRRAKNGTANITMSFHDDYIEKNAKFRNDAGLNCYIERIGSDCCEWCTEVAGKYLFGTQPKDVFRRHDKCDCVIIYDNKVLRGKKNTKGESTKTWEEVPDTERADYTPERISQRQAEKLQNQKLSQIRGLRVDNSGRSGIIDLRDSISNIFPDPVDKAPQLDYFDANGLNEQVKNAADLILENVKNHMLGTEFAYIISNEPPYTLSEPIVGEEGAMIIRIPRSESPSVTLHNHPSGETFSSKDIDRFVIDENARAMCVIGNNGNWYILEKNQNFSWYDFQIETLNISDNDNFTELILQEAEKYGFTYYQKIN